MQKLPNENGPYRLPKHFRHEEELIKYPKATPWRSTLINLNEGTVLARNGRQWCIVIAFYIIFFLCLAAFCAIFFFTYFTQLISDDEPTVLSKQPGFSYEPCILQKKNNKIVYHETVDDLILPYTLKIDEMFAKYGGLKDKEKFGECSIDDDYGYSKRKPCIFLKLNRVVGFKVEPYERPQDIPKYAPIELKKFVQSLPAPERKGRIWVSCKSNAEKMYMQFFPASRSYPVSSIELSKIIEHRKPNKNNVDASDPDDIKRFYDEQDFDRIIAVQLDNIPLDTTVAFECFIWAKNIIIEEYLNRRKGMVKFFITLPKDNPDKIILKYN